jgi:hypothetical protein
LAGEVVVRNIAFVVIPIGGPGENVTDEDLATAVEAVKPFVAHPITEPRLVERLAEQLMIDRLGERST